MSDAPTLQAIEQAIQEHHHEHRQPDEPAMVAGWIVAYVAVDGDRMESTNYAVGQGTTLVSAVGLTEWAKNHMLNGREAEIGDDE